MRISHDMKYMYTFKYATKYAQKKNLLKIPTVWGKTLKES
jgi:hypothetical protein